MWEVCSESSLPVVLSSYGYRKLCLFDVKGAYTFDSLPSVPRRSLLQPILDCQKRMLVETLFWT